jgi:hypothetical protein
MQGRHAARPLPRGPAQGRAARGSVIRVTVQAMRVWHDRGMTRFALTPPRAPPGFRLEFALLHGAALFAAVALVHLLMTW